MALDTAGMRELDRVLNSPVFERAAGLRKLLRYLTLHNLKRRGAAPKGSQIAREVLGKGEDFDSRVNPMVRMQVGRLRSKLAEYYATDGVNDELVIEIPKGSYTVLFRTRTRTAQQMAPVAGRVNVPVPEIARPDRLGWFRRFVMG